MASTLVAGTYAGAFPGYFTGSAGSLTPDTFSGYQCLALLADPTGVGGFGPGKVVGYFNGDCVAAVTGTTLVIGGVSYSQTTPAPSFNGSFTEAYWTAPDFVDGATYTVDVTGFVVYAGPTYVGVSTGNGAQAGFNIDFTSSGRTSGDRLFVAIVTANQAITAPTGFTEVANSPQSRGTAGAAGGLRLALFEKASTGSETTVAIADSGDHQYAVGFVVRGASGAQVEVDITAGGNAAAATACTFTGVTTTGIDRLVITVVGTDRDSAGPSFSGQANAALANLTEQHDAGTTAGAGGGIAIYSGTRQGAGATGSTTATQAASAAYCWITLALKNSAGGIVGTANITDGTDTTSAASTLANNGAATLTDQADSLVGSSRIGIIGNGVIQDEADALAVYGTGLALISGAAALVDDPDGLVATGVLPLTGTAAVEATDDVLSVTGALGLTGTAAIPDVDDTIIGSGKVFTVGSASLSDTNDALGAVGGLVIVGAGGIVEAADSVASIAALAIAGAAVLSDADDLAAGAGAALVRGEVEILDAADTVSATGALPLAGSASVRDDSDMVVATSLQIIAGTGGAALIDEPDALVATGTSTVSGSAGLGDAPDLLAAQGSLRTNGQATVADEDDTVTTEAGKAACADILDGEDALDAAALLWITLDGALYDEADTITAFGLVRFTGGALMGDNDDEMQGSARLRIVSSANVSDAADVIEARGSDRIPTETPPRRRLSGSVRLRHIYGVLSPSRRIVTAVTPRRTRG